MKINQIKCDQCGGNRSYHGWIEIKNSLLDLPHLDRPIYDFCNEDCLREFLNNREGVRITQCHADDLIKAGAAIKSVGTLNMGESLLASKSPRS